MNGGFPLHGKRLRNLESFLDKTEAIKRYKDSRTLRSWIGSNDLVVTLFNMPQQDGSRAACEGHPGCPLAYEACGGSPVGRTSNEVHLRALPATSMT